jgi:hypothetical protein
MLYPGFIGGTDVSQSSLANGERTMNWYVERLASPNAAAQLVLYPTPGVETVATLATQAAGRGHFFEDGREFAVIGTSFIEIDINGTTTVYGTVAVDANPATISTNGDGGGQLFITSGNNGYNFDLTTNTLSQVRTGATTMGAHLDGYFLALDAATSTLYLSDLLDGTTWDALQYAQRSIGSDPWVSMKVSGRFVWLFGSKTSEVWYNQGTFPFPFAPHSSGFVPYGTAAPFSPTLVSGALMWIAATEHGQGAVVHAAGFVPTVVATFAIHAANDGYQTIADAIGDTYEDLGHTFYLLSYPRANVTLCYDATQNLNIPAEMRWTERGTWMSESARYEAWRPLYHVFAFGEHRMLDRTQGTVYRLSNTSGVDVDDRPIRRMRRAAALSTENRRTFVPELEVLHEPGLGVVDAADTDPVMALRISRDGGKTWGSERTRTAGALGHYDTRAIWTRCGSARRWMPELVVSEATPWRILGARVRRSA